MQKHIHLSLYSCKELKYGNSKVLHIHKQLGGLSLVALMRSKRQDRNRSFNSGVKDYLQGKKPVVNHNIRSLFLPPSKGELEN